MNQPGGFIPPTTYLPSPAPSNYSSAASGSNDLLPNQRSTPLKSGSKAESRMIYYLDDALLEVSRKFTKKFPNQEEEKKINTANEGGGEGTDVQGYSDVEPLIEDVERLIGLIWISGTASLQIPYLLQIASSLLQYLPPFPPRPTPTFRLLNRLDLAFHLLIADYRMSGTEKVRLNSIVKITRAMVLRLMEGADTFAKDLSSKDTDDEDHEADVDEDSDSDPDEDAAMDVDEDTKGDVSKLSRTYARQTQKDHDRTERLVEEENEDENSSWEMECARVYNRVLEDIGGDLGSTPIGLVVEE